MTSIAEPVRADAAFGTDLYVKLAGPGNLVFSPASIAAALRMALTGARGDTAAELAAALHLSGPEAAADGLGQLAAIRTGDSLTFRAPDVMWLDESLHVREDFLRQLADTAAVERCDFMTAPEAARQAINNEIAAQTAGKITDLIPSGAIDLATRLVLTNAVYLKALWVHQFPAKDTKKKDFFPERTGPSPVDMMHLQERLAYYRGDGCQAVLLPYQDGPLAMAVVLPDSPLSDFTGGLAAAGGVGALLDGLLSSGSEVLVDLSLPRFRAEASFQLKDTLQALGVNAAFSGAADFSGIADEPLRISAVVHKAYVDVAEEGTEAAAATAVAFAMMAVMRRPQPDVQLVFDRPFLFVIADTASGLPLFLGQFTRPGSA